MYAEHFDLHSPPFENTPDPRFFFASEQHREALAAIEYTIRMRKGFVLVTGEIGSGKTTVGWTMRQRCQDSATIVQLTHGQQTRIELLQQILRTLQVRFRRDDPHARLIDRLREFCEQKIREDRPLVLVVDEAQTLSDETLEELRLLSNLDTAERRVIQIVLVGQPELRERLRQPFHDALRQRIAMAKQLKPMNITETRDYIRHRLRAAANDPDRVKPVFENAAIARIFAASRGVPRLVNAACDNAMLLAFVRETYTITADLVERVIEDMVPRFRSSPGGTLGLAGERAPSASPAAPSSSTTPAPASGRASDAANPAIRDDADRRGSAPPRRLARSA